MLQFKEAHCQGLEQYTQTHTANTMYSPESQGFSVDDLDLNPLFHAISEESGIIRT